MHSVEEWPNYLKLYCDSQDFKCMSGQFSTLCMNESNIILNCDFFEKVSKISAC